MENTNKNSTFYDSNKCFSVLSVVECFIVLFSALGSYFAILLLRSGNVERNPGPDAQFWNRNLNVFLFEIRSHATRLGYLSNAPDLLDDGTNNKMHSIHIIDQLTQQLELINNTPDLIDESVLLSLVNECYLLYASLIRIRSHHVHTYHRGYVHYFLDDDIPDILQPAVHDLVREGIEPNPGPSSDNALTAGLVRLRQRMNNTWLELELDHAYGIDEFTDDMLQDFCDIKHRVYLAIQSEDFEFRMRTLDTARRFMNCFVHNYSLNKLKFAWYSVVQTDDDEIIHEDPLLWSVDLTTQGIEPNPGPVLSKFVHPRHNRFSGCNPVMDDFLFPVALAQIVKDFFHKPVAQMGLVDWALGSRLTDTLPKVLERVDNVVLEANNDIRQSMSDIREDVSGVMTKVPEIMKTFLDSQCGFLPVDVRSVLQLLASVLCLYLVYKALQISLDIVMTIFTGVCCLLGMPAHVVNVVREYFTKDDVPCAQVGEEEIVMKSLPGAFGLLGALLTSYMSYELPSRPHNVDIWLRRVKDLPLTCRSFSQIYEFCTTQFRTIWNFVKVDCFGYDPDLFGDGIPEIEKWVRTVMAHTDQNYLDAACQSRDGVKAATMLWLQGEQLFQKYSRAMDRNAQDSFKRMLVQAARIKSSVEIKFPLVDGVRMSPLCIWLVGESQIGKTQMQFFLASHLTKELGTQANVKDQIYVRAPENVFWDGYHGQDIVCLDDFGQLRDVAGTPNPEFFELIRGVSHFPYPLHMADISQKANTAFTSKAFICSTNAQNVKIESLTYEEAVWNRFTHSYKVVLKREYTKEYERNGRLHVCMDREKVLRDAPMWNGERAPVNLNIYEFYPFDARSRMNPVYGNPKSFDEVARELRVALRARLEGGSALDKYLDHYTANIAQIGEDIKTLTPRYMRLPSWAENLDHFVRLSALCDKSVSELLQWVMNANVYACDIDLYDELYDHFERTIGESCFDSTPLKEVSFPTVECGAMQISHYLIKFYLSLFPVEKNKYQRTWDKIRRGFNSACDLLSPFARKLYDYFQGFCTWVKTSQSAPMWAFVLIGLVSGFTKIYCNRESSCAESDTKNAQPRARAHQVARSRARLLPKKTAQMGVDLNQQNVITKVLKNQYLMIANFASKCTTLGTMTVVTGTIAMIPDHFRLYLQSSEEQPTSITLRSAYGVVEYNIPLRSFFSSYDHNDGNFVTFNTCDDNARDLCFVDLTQCIPRHANIVKHFISASEIVKLNDGFVEVTLTGMSVRNEKIVCFDRTGLASAVNNVEYELRGDKHIKCVATDVFKYHFATTRGDCGATLTVNSPLVKGKVIGMHVAGSLTNNWSQAITCEDIQLAVDEFPAIAQCEGQFVNLQDDPCVEELSGFQPRGVLPHDIPSNGKTNLKRSTLYGLVAPALTKPAYLYPRVVDDVLVDPLLNGIRKAAVPRPALDMNLLEVCKNDVSSMLRTEYVPCAPQIRVLEYEEAITGVVGDPLFHGVSRSTSPGYPYCLYRKGKGKTAWMGKDDYDFSSPDALQLKSDVMNLIESCRNSTPNEILWIDTLKDERRPIAKVDKMKTRVFSNGPQHFNIAFRMYFMSALAFWRHNRIHNGTTVGLNVWSNEWDFLYRFLSTHSVNIVAGDFESHDGNVHDQPMWAICDIFNEQYNDGNDIIRKNLWSYVTYAARCFRNRVYICTHSLPSGFIATADVSSVYELIMFRYVYILVAREFAPHYANLSSFNQFVKLVTYGDDNLVSISPHILDWFNMISIRDGFSKIGQTYTDAAKTGVVVPYQHISEVQYLKRTFTSIKLRNDVMSYRKYCPADLPSRLDMLNWTRHGSVEDYRVIERQTIQDVYKELAMHGFEVFNKYTKIIARFALENGITGVVNEGFEHYLDCEKPLYF